jgi:hypothetical protein
MPRHTEIDLDTLDRHNDYGNGSAEVVWDACDSTIFHVVDENGVNMADAQVRHLLDDSWLYVDEADGYQIMGFDDVRSLRLVSEKPALGYDRNGDVIEL